MRPRVLPWLLVLLIATALLCAGVGAVELGVEEMLGFLAGEGEPARAAIFWDLRLPRVVLAALVGAILSVSGAGLQGLFRNPLADPTIVGVSTGAAFGAVAGIVFLQSGSAYAVPACAFAGALVATTAALRLGRSSESLLLAGMAIAALCMAGMGLFIYLADDGQLRSISFWNLGSLGAASWPVVLAVAVPGLVCALAWGRLARPLDLLLLGEGEAAHSGIPVRRVRREIILVVALGVGASVAWTGIISFVGLLVPHVVRALTGPAHRRLLPASAIAGAILLVAADAVSRTVAAPAELPIGVVTAIAGAPFLLYLVVREMIAGVDLAVPRRLAGISLAVHPGEVVGVIGPSGAGKSTLLSVLAGDLTPETGTVRLEDRPLSSFRADDLARRRAVLPQSSSLAFNFRVEEVVRLGRTPWGDQSAPPVRRALADVGLTALAQRDYLTLSGGERQRVHLARVLCQLDGAERPLLLCDEPTAHLDVGHVRGVLSVLRAIAARGAGVLVVLHDLQAALTYTDRLALVGGGRLLENGAPAKVLASRACTEAFDCPIQVRELDGKFLVITG